MLCLLCNNQNCLITGLPVTVQLPVWIELILTLYLLTLFLSCRAQSVPRVTLFMMWKWAFGQEILNCIFLKLLLLVYSTFYHLCFTVSHTEKHLASKHFVTSLDRSPFEHTRLIKKMMAVQLCINWMSWCFSFWYHWWWNYGFSLGGMVVKDSKQASLVPDLTVNKKEASQKLWGRFTNPSRVLLCSSEKSALLNCS